VQEPAIAAAEGTGPRDLLINLLGLTVFSALLYYDNAAAQQRIEQRKEVRQAQIAFGDREVYVNDQGDTMSRLKEVRGVTCRGLSEDTAFVHICETSSVRSVQSWIVMPCSLKTCQLLCAPN
jgi:hypothetical protein